MLGSDRAGCSPEIMEALKNDIIKVISKYMEIDTDNLNIEITQTESDADNGYVPALCANIPIKDIIISGCFYTFFCCRQREWFLSAAPR